MQRGHAARSRQHARLIALRMETGVMLLVFFCLSGMLWCGMQAGRKRIPVSTEAEPLATGAPVKARPTSPYTAGTVPMQIEWVPSPDEPTAVASRSYDMLRGEAVSVSLTGYCSCARCCGQWAQYGLTASGTAPKAKHTIAHETLPFGTKVLIGDTVYTVEDRGVKGASIDIYFDTHSEALRFGRQQDTVMILPEP